MVTLALITAGIFFGYCFALYPRTTRRNAWLFVIPAAFATAAFDYSKPFLGIVGFGVCAGFPLALAYDD